MKSISWRVHLGFIVFGYAAVLVVAAALLYERHLQELRDPAGVVASGGMYAGGDALLEIFIVCLFMIPTVLLIYFVARSEALYGIYSRLLLGLSVSAPVCLSAFYLGEKYLAQSVILFCLYRLFWSPFVLVGLAVSRLAARFDRAKRLVSYALLIEGLTLAIAVALVIHAWGGPRNH